MQHKFLTHENCSIPDCAICKGEAKICTVCGCTSPRLTTECSGLQLKFSQITRILEGTLDFAKGRWIDSRNGELIDDVLKFTIGQRLAGTKKGENWVYIGRHETSEKINVHHFIQEVAGQYLGDKQGYKRVRHIKELAKFLAGDFENDRASSS